MTSNDQLQRLYKILKNSSRVREVREMFGLGDGEFIIQFTNKNTRTTTDGSPDGRHVSQAEADSVYFYSDIEDWVQKNIVERFGLSLDVATVLKAIFFQKDYVPPTSYHSRTRVNPQGNFEIVIEFFEQPSAASRADLQKTLSKDLELLDEFYRTKNTTGLKTAPSPYERMKTIQDFDVRYDLTKRYKQILSQYPEHSNDRKAMLEELTIGAKSALGKKTTFTIDDVRKLVDEFENYFGEVSVG